MIKKILYKILWSIGKHTRIHLINRNTVAGLPKCDVRGRLSARRENARRKCAGVTNNRCFLYMVPKQYSFNYNNIPYPHKRINNIRME